MKNKKILILFGILLIGIFLIENISAVGEISYCCEKTLEGAWCQNAPENKCDVSGDLRAAPTSCEATSYCKKGCCYDSQEGTCTKNTPQKVCEDSGGVWNGDADCDIPQCTLGCCLIGEQAAFVTQVRCKRLSSLYGLEINFRKDITNEIECIASASSDVKGACVFERDYEKTCLLTTQKECKEMESSNSNVSFHEGYLCSAETLGTNCGPTEKTTCVEGRDEVYFVDSCGNLANIYDADKIKNKEYWSKIKTKSESCNPSSSNANSRTCGNCDYFLGSVCKEYKRGETANPKYGDYICKDLNCEYEGKEYLHGETWCAESKGIDKNSPGSRYFRLVCYTGEVTVEPCADFRQEICKQSEINNGFKTSGCIANKWQDCIAQNNKKDCENEDKRDCVWTNTEYTENTAKGQINCFPEYPPGFDFWKEETESSSICSKGDIECTVVYEEKYDHIFGDKVKKCVENCQCLEESWEEKMNKRCNAFGDCGDNINYIGIIGFSNSKTNYFDDSEEEKEENDKTKENDENGEDDDENSNEEENENNEE
jgi:hypothetical protein